jgi:hypothetical protein
MSRHLSEEVRACIDACHACSTICLSDATGHCLEKGGRHTEPAHFRLVLDCADICATAARFMARNSEHHPHICRECAEICRACADSCRQFGEMDECVAACTRCAESCERMAA